MNRLIYQHIQHHNRLKIKAEKLPVVHLEVSLFPERGYYKLTPLSNMWRSFWDVWNLHKDDLKVEGLSVKKEKGQWVIHYTPPPYILFDDERL